MTKAVAEVAMGKTEDSYDKAAARYRNRIVGNSQLLNLVVTLNFFKAMSSNIS